MKRMKQSKQVFLLVVAFILLMTGCTDNSKLLVNTWTVSDLKYTSEVPKDMQPTIDQSVENMKRAFRLTYNSDGTYLTQMNDQVLKGKWKMNWNSSRITSTASNGTSKDFKILELTENKFSFEADEGGQKVIFVMVPAKQIPS
jgi:hypothetical protein